MSSSFSLPTLLEIWQAQLKAWSLDGAISKAARSALSLEGSQPLLKDLESALAAGDFSGLPPVELLPATSMPGAAGACAASTGTIYFNEDWLLTATVEAIISVLTEELGAFLDDQLNTVDTQGDEGALFSAELLGLELTKEERSAIAAEDDRITITVAAQSTGAEANNAPDVTSSLTEAVAAPAAPSTPDLTSASDTGSSNTDNLTSDNTPTFSGTAAAGTAVELFSGGISLGTTTADDSGTWIYTVPATSALADGTTAITAVATEPIEEVAILESISISQASPDRTTQEWRNRGAFAALKEDGSVVTWGRSDLGGDISSVSSQLASGVSQIFSTYSAFAALKDDGFVITWGPSWAGGDSSSVAGDLQSGVVSFADPFQDDRLVFAGSGSELTSDPSPALTLTIDTTAPSFTSAGTATAIDENSGAAQVVYTASTSDTFPVTYSLKPGNNDDATSFSIDSSSGQVTLSVDPDHESQSSYNFTIQATDSAGNTSEQSVTLEVNNQPDVLNISIGGTVTSAALSSYSNQDIDSNAVLSDDDNTLTLTGNTWFKADVATDSSPNCYSITPNTILSFSFDSSSQGEIQGIGFDNDDATSLNRTFQLSGSQTWGLQAFNNTYTTGSGPQTYTIPVSDFYTGSFQYLTFLNDDDTPNDPLATDSFSKIRIF